MTVPSSDHVALVADEPLDGEAEASQKRFARRAKQAQMIGLFIAGNLLAPPAVRWLTQYMEHHRGTRLVGKAMHLLGLPALQFATYYYGTFKPYFELLETHQLS